MTPEIAVESSEIADVDSARMMAPELVAKMIIEKGEDLVVHRSSSGVPKAKAKAKPLTWFDESERLARKRRGM